jgi:hypothetical protein
MSKLSSELGAILSEARGEAGITSWIKSTPKAKVESAAGRADADAVAKAVNAAAMYATSTLSKELSLDKADLNEIQSDIRDYLLKQSKVWKL